MRKLLWEFNNGNVCIYVGKIYKKKLWRKITVFWSLSISCIYLISLSFASINWTNALSYGHLYFTVESTLYYCTCIIYRCTYSIFIIWVDILTLHMNVHVQCTCISIASSTILKKTPAVSNHQNMTSSLINSFR